MQNFYPAKMTRHEVSIYTETNAIIRMSSKDDSYCEPNDGHSNELPSYNLRSRSGGGAATAGSTNSARNRSNGPVDTGRTQTRIPTDAKSVAKSLQHIEKCFKCQSHDTNTSLRVVHAALTPQAEHLRDKQRSGTRASTTKICERVSSLLGISTHTYTKIMQSYYDKKSTVYSTGNKGNYNENSREFPKRLKLLWMYANLFEMNVPIGDVLQHGKC